MVIETVIWGIALILAGVLMAKSAEIIIKSLTKISRFFNLSEFAISFILMAAATSLPELFVGVNASLMNDSVLVLGDVIGSNIVDLTLVLGITVLIARNIRVRSSIAKRDSLYMFFLGSFPLLLLVDGVLSKLEGLSLIFFYILYLSRLLKQKSEFSSKLGKTTGKEAFYNLFFFIIGIATLLLSARIIIMAAEHIAFNLNLPLTFIGLVLVSVGTSLPELIFETKAIRNFHSELALGDLMGSIVTNTTLVLGISAMINPIQIQVPNLFYSSTIFLVAIMILFNIFIRTERKIETSEAIIMIFMYIVFLIMELYVGLTIH